MNRLIIILLLLSSCGTVKKSSTYNRSLSHETNYSNQLITFEKKGLLLTLKQRAVAEKLDSAGNVTERTVTDSEMTIKDEGEITTKEDLKGGEKIQETITEETKLKRKRSPPWWLVVIPAFTLWVLYKYRFKLISLIKPLLL
jgi:hypothetical protein